MRHLIFRVPNNFDNRPCRGPGYSASSSWCDKPERSQWHVLPGGDLGGGGGLGSRVYRV